MADYNATARSNYFRVKDLTAFKNDLTRHGLTATGWYDQHCGHLVLDTDETNEPKGSIALFATDDHGTWPFLGDRDEIVYRLEEVACNAYEPLSAGGRRAGWVYNEANLPCDSCAQPQKAHTDTTAYADDISQLVSRHLVDGDVAVFMEAGAEKQRYVGGSAVAVNNRGDVVSLCLDDIYDKAADMGQTLTQASY